MFAFRLIKKWQLSQVRKRSLFIDGDTGFTGLDFFKNQDYEVKNVNLLNEPLSTDLDSSHT